MLEKPEVTLEILRYFAREDIPYPSRLTAEKIYEEFEGREERYEKKDVQHSLLRAIQKGLLDGEISYQNAIGQKRKVYFTSLDGLSPQGEEYVREKEDEKNATGYMDISSE